MVVVTVSVICWIVLVVGCWLVGFCSFCLGVFTVCLVCC